jgi:hypothetical protein
MIIFLRISAYSLDEVRLEEYFCQPEMTISDELKNSKFVRLRGLTMPNDTGVSIGELYPKAVNRLIQSLPHVKYVSLSAEYEYSADDSVSSYKYNFFIYSNF